MRATKTDQGINRDCDVQVALHATAAMAIAEDQVPEAVVVHEAPARVAQTLKALRRSEALDEVPLIVVAADASADDELAWLQAGAVDLLTPATPPRLFNARVQVHLAYSRKLGALRREARIDGLTQVPNRAEFERIAALEWRRGLRSKLPLALLMIDVDHFKAYNDRFGHLQGDGALRHVAGAIHGACVRASDVVARYGGEEFAAILPDSDLSAAVVVAQRLHRDVEALGLPNPGASDAAPLTVTVGVAALVPTRERTLADLVGAADAALLAGKRGGRNRVVAG